MKINYSRNYFLYFLVIAMLMLASQLLVYMSIAKHEDFSRKMNLTARQKSLAQEIILDVMLINRNDIQHTDDLDIVLVLETHLEKWQNTQMALVNGSDLYKISGDNSRKVQTMLGEISPPFIGTRDMIEPLIKGDSTGTRKIDIETLLPVSNRYLEGMSHLHAQLTAEHDGVVRNTILLCWLMAIVSVILLTAAFLLIIKPMVSKLKQHNESLKIANTSLLEANRMKSEMASNFTAELFRPIDNILGAASIIDKAETESEIKSLAKTIRNDAYALSRLVNDVIDFSKTQSGTLELNNERFDLQSCLEGIVDEFKPLALAKNLELVFDMAPSLIREIVQDEYRLRQVLSNLLNNAIKFTTHGEILLRVELDADEFNFLQIKFTVQDTGIGFSSAKSDKIFESFVQGETGQNRRFAGTGLGLALCKSVVELMGGRIWTESEELKGSKFMFTIIAERSETSHDVVMASLAGKKALVVDDNRTSLKILVKQLSTWGIQATPFNSPELVADVLGNMKKFDFCIIDLEMPVMDGRQLARKIKEEYKSESLPLIALSADNKQLVEDRENLFDAFITKPLKQSRLLDAIISALQSHLPQPGQDVKLARGAAHLIPGGIKILIAQDNDLLRAVANKSVKSLGYPCRNAASTNSLVDALRNEEFDLLLLDMKISGDKPSQVIKRIKETIPEKKLPVIIGLSEDANRDLNYCIDSGMDDCMNRAVRSYDLEERINHFFEGEHLD